MSPIPILPLLARVDHTFHLPSIKSDFDRNGEHSALLLSDANNPTPIRFGVREGFALRLEGEILQVGKFDGDWEQANKLDLTTQNTKFCVQRNGGGIGIADIRPEIARRVEVTRQSFCSDIGQLYRIDYTLSLGIVAISLGSIGANPAMRIESEAFAPSSCTKNPNCA